MSQPSRASEDSILACLARHFPATHPSLLLGRGDDCAVLKAGTPLCVSSDLFLEDVHFRRSYFTPEEIGHKALAVNVSDIAACGGRPLAFTLALGLPDDVDALWLDRFFSGMAALAQEQRLALAGGDLSRSPFLHVSITIWGESYTGGDFLVRGGSMPGDSLFVVGRPGLARVGLQVLEKEGRAALEHWPAACAAHLLPVPQVDAGLMLARAGANARPPALMDLSDGIMRDLPRLLGRTGESRARREGDTGTATDSGLGAAILLPQGMLHPEVVRHARENGLNPVHEALLGGEDYALLGSCAPDMLPILLARAGANARPPALMDLSDGIMRDLPRLLGRTGESRARREGDTGTATDSGLGAAILLPQGMLHPEVVRHARENGLNPVHEALLGGEDYALLGSCAPDMLPILHAAIPGFMSIGTITDDGELTCNNEPLDALQGFDHFAVSAEA